MPTTEAYEYGCYESQISYFAKGTAEEIQSNPTVIEAYLGRKEG